MSSRLPGATEIAGSDLVGGREEGMNQSESNKFMTAPEWLNASMSVVINMSKIRRNSYGLFRSGLITRKQFRKRVKRARMRMQRNSARIRRIPVQ